MHRSPLVRSVLLATLPPGILLLTITTWPRADVAAPIDLGPVRGFVANHGQWPAAVHFVATNGGQWLHVGSDGMRCGSGAAAVTFDVVSGRGGAPVANDPTGAVCNFFVGSDASRHVVGVPVVRSVRQHDVAPGVDLVLRPAAGGSGAFAYDLVCEPGAELGAVEFAVAGADDLRIDAATGELVVVCTTGSLRQSAPVAWLEADGTQVPVACRFELRAADRFGFVAPQRSLVHTLVVDPDLRWATTFGGTSDDHANGVATATNGDVFVAGTTRSMNLPAAATVFDPTWNGAGTQPFAGGDGFVARFAAADGALTWCTYVGGLENDSVSAARAIGGDVVVTGWTTSVDFPTTPGAFDTSHNGTGDGYLYGGGDVFVTRVAANGQALVWSTFLGGAQLEYPLSIAVDAAGEVAVSGHVHSPNFPTTPGAFATTLNAFSDLFVTRLAANGATLVGSTYCGGSDGEEYTFALAILPDGDLVAAGATDSSDLPVTPGAYDPTYNGGTEHLADGYVMRFDRTCSVLRWCTYLGTPANEYPRGIAVHVDGSMTFSGQIDGPGLPTTANVVGPAPLGGTDGFLWRLAGDGTTSPWASYVGSSGDDRLERAVDVGGGRVAAVGSFAAPAPMLTRGAWQAAAPGGTDGWLLVVAGDGTSIDYATAIGGSSGDLAIDVHHAADGELVVAGSTWSADFPVTAAGVPAGPPSSVFCVQLAALPLGVTRHGAPSGACARAARVRTRSAPFVGDPAFAFTCGDLPPGAFALAAVSAAAATSPLPLLGIDVWLDVPALLATPAVTVTSYGSAVLPVPIPANPALVGATLAAQFVFVDACPTPAVGASDVLAIVVQP